MELLDYIREFRIFNYAIFDLIVSFLWIYLLSPFLSKSFFKIWIIIPKVNWLFLTLPIWIFFHVIFWSFTPMTENFLDFSDFYVLKWIVIILLFLWLRNIKINK